MRLWIALGSAVCIYRILNAQVITMSDPATKILQFPSGRSVGWVKIPSTAPDPHDYWHLVGLADGAVTVPVGVPVRLVVGLEAGRDLSFLDALLPDDLQQLWLGQSDVTNKELAHLEPLTGLSDLGLSDTDITDAGLPHLRPLHDLRRLSLNGTRITDAGVPYMCDYSYLEDLLLGGTFLTDAGLSQLQGLLGLRRISLDDVYCARPTLITTAGVAALQRTFPTCEISWPRWR